MLHEIHLHLIERPAISNFDTSTGKCFGSTIDKGHANAMDLY